MVIRAARFNLNLLLALALVAFAGCHTTKEDKERAVVRIHIEVNQDGTGQNAPVPIYRGKPVMVNVQTSPFLTEANLVEAKVLETLGGFALQIKFDNFGAGLLEQYSARNPGKHMAIFCQFGKKLVESRWLAAPQIGRRITNGMLVFTPDCTREEAEQIALGLNNVLAKSKRRDLIK